MVNSLLQTVIFRSTVTLIILVFVYFFISIVFFLFKGLVHKIRSRMKWRHLNSLYDVLFNGLPLDALFAGTVHRFSLIEAFTEILSQINLYFKIKGFFKFFTLQCELVHMERRGY